ncbi:MAG: hypothetical protein ACOYMN_06710 [Roseimicrobium sp.]
MNKELIARYHEGYQAAASAIQFGNGIRAFGILLGLVVAGAGLWAGANGQPAKMATLLSAGFLAALLFAAVGVIVAVQGRILRSTLDTSAGMSPMLSAHERALVIR